MTAATPQDREYWLRRADLAARQCGPCDVGLPMACECDPEPRAVIAALLDMVTVRESVIAQAQARPVPPPHPSTMAGRLPPSEQTCPGGC